MHLGGMHLERSDYILVTIKGELVVLEVSFITIKDFVANLLVYPLDCNTGKFACVF